MIRRQVLAHVHHILPLVLLRVRHMRIHRFGGRLEVIDVATLVIQRDQLQMQVDVIRMLG